MENISLILKIAYSVLNVLVLIEMIDILVASIQCDHNEYCTPGTLPRIIFMIIVIGVMITTNVAMYSPNWIISSIIPIALLGIGHATFFLLLIDYNGILFIDKNSKEEYFIRKPIVVIFLSLLFMLGCLISYGVIKEKEINKVYEECLTNNKFKRADIYEITNDVSGSGTRYIEIKYIKSGELHLKSVKIDEDDIKIISNYSLIDPKDFTKGTNYYLSCRTSKDDKSYLLYVYERKSGKICGNIIIVASPKDFFRWSKLIS